MQGVVTSPLILGWKFLPSNLHNCARTQGNIFIFCMAEPCNKSVQQSEILLPAASFAPWVASLTLLVLVAPSPAPYRSCCSRLHHLLLLRGGWPHRSMLFPIPVWGCHSQRLRDFRSCAN